MATTTNTTLPESRDSHLLERMHLMLWSASRLADELSRACATTIGSNALNDICTVLDATIGELEAAADAAYDDEEELRAAERAAWYRSNSYKRA